MIPTCAEYCVNTDDSSGHYTCNYQNGTKQCLDGWCGSNCLKIKTVCSPRDDEYGHYNCDPVTESKICLQGWRDVSSNCTKGGYLVYQFQASRTNFRKKLMWICEAECYELICVGIFKISLPGAELIKNPAS